MSDRLLYFNGIDGDTGDYFLEPRSVDEFAELVERRELEPQGAPKRLKFGLDPLDLADAGWGVVWPEDADPAVRAALAGLIEHRRAQATRRCSRYFQELTYYPGETTLEFWRRHGLGPDAVDPAKMPYYLLIVGEPRDIPFDFQFELGMPYAVGRLSFDDPEDYAAYARQLIDGESRPLPPSPTIAFFGVENPSDELTRLSVASLVKPLEERIAEARQDWRVKTWLRHAADKAQLVRLLHDDGSPAVLLTASHAMRFRIGTERQLSHQGALVCADWPGREAWAGRGPMPEDFLFSGQDVAGARLDRLIAFHFGCYTAGTPHLDAYARDEPAAMAPEPFVARLPQELLRRGALAVVGHVDVAMEQSFFWHGAGPQLETFDSTLQAIMAGYPIGHALDHFRERFGVLATQVAGAVRADQRGDDDAKADQLRHFKLWAAYQDARSYMILGDPAARLNVAND